ncbi:MAG TPA: SAM-dependent methyltransferase, partial [Myxococcota bacterium]|nr:SAM-dependent methyltransferase [Myxococcota bacterium]
LAERAPRAWAWLEAHRARLDARRSSIYRGRPPFSVFGLGPYTFAPWKVAISGMHKEPVFALVGPHGGRPVALDDTCYLLPFDDEAAARDAWERLRSPQAAAFLRARVFPDDKRPIRAELLQQLDLRRL